MELHLRNKIAIISGASRGIGAAIATTLANEGVKTVLVARTESLLKSISARIAIESLCIAIDLKAPGAAATIANATIERFGSIDLLINNAGDTRRGDFLTLSDAEWDDGFALKFFGGMKLSREVWPHLVRSNGAIINIVGAAGRTASADFAIGGSVNAAVLNLTKSLADRGIKDGVRVNAINPGLIATERLQSRLEAIVKQRGISRDVAEQEMLKALKISRFGQPEDIAMAVAFLASPNARHVQGSIVDIDGGQTRTL